ncbi:MAG TPA: hypothetical protein VGD53_03000 [Actinoallomurus sp.]|jgi:pimeloyl-ACP methyl ester carboxylesterase
MARALLATASSAHDDAGALTTARHREGLDTPALITIPTLAVVGRHDVIRGPRWASEPHDRIPGSTLVVLGDSGHFGHLEEPWAFARAVAERHPVAMAAT